MTREEGREGEQGKEGKGSSQGTCMKDLWTWTTGWGLTVGVGDGLGRGEQGGEIETTVIEQQKYLIKNNITHHSSIS